MSPGHYTKVPIKFPSFIAAVIEADIILHQATKKSFDDLGYGKDKKLPTVTSLRAECGEQLAEKGAIYQEYRQAQTEMREQLVVKSNADSIFDVFDRGLETERDE